MRTFSTTVVLLLLTVSTVLPQGSLLLVGGGGEDYNDWSDVPYRWLVTQTQNRQILVLHYADTTSFFSSYFPWLSSCTVHNRAITSSLQANDSVLYRFILDHDGIFLRGGDQWQYVNRWKGTLTEQAIREVYARGGVIGGSSAGEAVLGEIIFDARLASVSPRTALRNPLGAGITLTDDFLQLGTNLLGDSHFFERGRLGRLPAFLAVYKQSKGREVVGLGVDYNTALAIGPDGVGEVMGSGTVTVLRYGPETETVLTSAQPLSMRNLRLDQLTAGTRIAFGTGAIQESPSATPYLPGRFAAPGATIFLDGSNAVADWSAANGSLKSLQNALSHPADTIGILASPTTPTSAQAVAATFSSWGVAWRSLWLDGASAVDPLFAASLASCRGFVFAGNVADSAAHSLDSTTLAGEAFRTGVASGSPVAFLGDDVILAGEYGIGQMYRSRYGAYYGYLVQTAGLGLLKGMQIVSRLYESSDYIDNRASSVFWSMARSHLPYGMLVDNGTLVTIAAGKAHVAGATPLMLVDARDALWASLPSWRDPGKAYPRQNGGIIGGRLHILRAGDVFELESASAVQSPGEPDPLPLRTRLWQNYPNPFNPTTTIRYSVGSGVGRNGSENSDHWTGQTDPTAARIRLAVYDVLGQEVAVLVDAYRPPGVHEVQWNAAGLSSGAYFCRMVAGASTQSRVMLLMK